MADRKKMNIALVTALGGHFEQMTNLYDFYKCYDHFWITHRNKQTEGQSDKERMYFIEKAHYKKPWTHLFQILPLLNIILIREKPTHILSTGSGRAALIPFLISRVLGIKFIHIDTFSRVCGYSKFGTFLLKTGNKIYTQWEDAQNEKAIYIGPVFRGKENYNQSHDAKHVFVTLGTRDESFIRLLKAIEGLVKKDKIKEKVVIQAGHTKYSPKCADVFDFCTPEMVDELISNAKYVITQESAGIATQCLKYRKKFIVMPRDYRYGELPSKSDMKEDLHYKLEELGYTKVVRNADELEKAVEGLEKLKVGFHFDNTLAIRTLKELIETGASSQ